MKTQTIKIVVGAVAFVATGVAVKYFLDRRNKNLSTEEKSLTPIVPEEVISPPPVEPEMVGGIQTLRLVPSSITVEEDINVITPNELFDQYYESLIKRDRFKEFDEQWGSIKRGYYGLIKHTHKGGEYCSRNPITGDRLIYRTDIGDVIAVYEQTVNGSVKILHSEDSAVEVKFASVELTAGELQDYIDDNYILKAS